MKSRLTIEVDPEIMSGTRIPVQSLFEHLESDFSIEEFVELFPTGRRENVIELLERTKSDFLEQALK